MGTAMRWLLLLAICGLPWMLCSCRTGTTVSGDPCYALSQDEVDELVAIARMSLRKPRRQLTPTESHANMNGKPEVDIFYNGDCRIGWGENVRTHDKACRHFRDNEILTQKKED